jgi:vesicle-fusing ATPase
LISVIQHKLKDAAPGKSLPSQWLFGHSLLDLWLMPVDNLHITVMEVAHSKTEAEIQNLIEKLRDHHKDIADHTCTHRARLIKPLLSYDSAALALSFVPAAGELLPHGRPIVDDEYTYHHLRRDAHTALTDAGVQVGSRYVVPSAHLTIARFNSPNVFGGDPMDKSATLEMKARKHWINEIEMINKWLQAEFWPEENQVIKPGGEWIVGEEKGLDFRYGKLWYGGGETIYLGQGFVDGKQRV